MKKLPVRLPTSSDRIVICGQTGSGKSQAGVWHLSNADIDSRPWIIVDGKNDPTDLINNIEKSTLLDYSDKIPTKPGVYLLKVYADDKEELVDFFQRIHSQGGVGIFADEGYILGQHNKWFNTCLMQGRGLRIPMIVLTQRPVRVTPWAFSEANFWQVFNLVKRGDREIVAADVPIPVDYELPRFHSYYYDVAERRLTKMAPVPEGQVLLAKIDAKLPRKRREI